VRVQGTVAAAQQALAAVDRSAIAAVAVSGQQHGLVALDSTGSVLRPAKLWCDTESAPEAAELSQSLGYAVVSTFTLGIVTVNCWPFGVMDYAHNW